jgi:SAM-dependent methyltransferase
VSDEEQIRQQIAYYRARASEYDQWFPAERDATTAAPRIAPRGSERWRPSSVRWAEEIEGHSVLELACGTGLWTRYLAAADRRVVALDASPEVIAINRSRVTGKVPLRDRRCLRAACDGTLRHGLLRVLAVACAGDALRRFLADSGAACEARRRVCSSWTACSSRSPPRSITARSTRPASSGAS